MAVARLATLLLLLLAADAAHAFHTEQLHVRPLAHVAKTLAHFHFETHEPLHDATLAPRVLRQILTKYDAAALHLSFSVGHYDHARYGIPEGVDGLGPFHAPFGARLQVAFHRDAASSAAASFDDRWKGVTSELGGIFSASLNRMDETSIAKTLAAGVRSTAEFGGSLNATGRLATPDSVEFLQATLAREELCTENLTPWLKMLPCRAHAGLGALIDPIRILSGEYAMLSISASRDHDHEEWTVEQRLTTVQPTPRSASTSLASVLLDGSDIAVTQLAACPLADTSVITTEGDASAIDLKALEQPLSTTQSWLPAHSVDASSTLSHDAVAVHRFQTGYGQVHGGLAVRLENRDPSCSMQVIYNDVSQWFLRLYFHTFQTRLTALDDDRDLVSNNISPAFSFVPAELRGRPNQFRVQVELPPRSALVLSVQFDKVFVRLSEHPPDANRGFDIPSGVATFTPVLSGSCAANAFTRVVYSEPLLVALPTPDFSMPYNVITLTSTVVAFFAGSMLNTLLRKAPRIQRMLADAPKTK